MNDGTDKIAVSVEGHDPSRSVAIIGALDQVQFQGRSVVWTKVTQEDEWLERVGEFVQREKNSVPSINIARRINEVILEANGSACRVEVGILDHLQGGGPTIIPFSGIPSTKEYQAWKRAQPTDGICVSDDYTGDDIKRKINANKEIKQALQRLKAEVVAVIEDITSQEDEVYPHHSPSGSSYGKYGGERTWGRFDNRKIVLMIGEFRLEFRGSRDEKYKLDIRARLKSLVSSLDVLYFGEETPRLTVQYYNGYVESARATARLAEGGIFARLAA